MAPLWLSIAFLAGFGAKILRLPPLIGYLVAGFILHALGVREGPLIKDLSDLGIILLLFTIGLKLKIRDIARLEIVGGAVVHMLIVSALYGIILFALSYTGYSSFATLDWKLSVLVAFGLSFSSTVFAVKVLEEKGEMNSLHGSISIGILIMQDLFAVAFLVAAAGKVPSVWALALVPALVIMRPVLLFLLNRSGHDEILVLYGLFLALVAGAELFVSVGMKADLGALVIGMLLAHSPRAKELASSLLRFKDIFLIGFFLSIGLSGAPTLSMVVIAFILALGINFKVFFYFLVLTRFRLWAWTSLHASLTLANYSEFGLIVAATAVKMGLLPQNWMIILALALSISFVVSAPLNTHAHGIYAFLKKWLGFFETRKRLAYDKTFDIGDAEILILGIGHLGIATYDRLNSKYGQRVLALDYDEERVKKNQEQGRRVIHDDATDSEFWERISNKPFDQVKLVMLCMDDHPSNRYALERLKAIDYQGQIAATARYDDEVAELAEMGVDSAYNLYSEAGIGFADQVCLTLNSCEIRFDPEQKDVESKPLP